MMKKYGLIIGLILIAVLMIVVKIKNRNAVYQPVMMSPTPTAKPTINYSEYPLWDYLPHIEKEFRVEKYVDKNTLEIKIISGKKTSVEKKVNEWLKTFNLKEKQLLKFIE